MIFMVCSVCWICIVKLVPDFLVLIQTWPRMNLVVSIKVGFGILSPSTILHALLPFFKLQ